MPMPEALPVGVRERKKITQVSLKIKKKKKNKRTTNLGPRSATEEATNRGGGGWRCTRGEDDEAGRREGNMVQI
jgi:hypothetical protein